MQSLYKKLPVEVNSEQISGSGTLPLHLRKGFFFQLNTLVDADLKQVT